MKVVRLSALCTGRLYLPGIIPDTLFHYSLSQPQSHSVASRFMSMKNSSDTIGSQPATFWPVAQCLNKLCHSVPPFKSVSMLFWIAGVVHLDDLLYLFPQNQMLPNLKFTPDDEDMVDTMTSLWVNFAHTGYVRHVLYCRVQLIH
jgi:hypothetical protein